MPRSRSLQLLAMSSVSAIALLAGARWAEAALGGSSGVTIPYSGRLDLNGAPVNGPVAFYVDVYNQQNGGTACFTSASIPVDVFNGAFSLVAGSVPESCVKGRQVWLAIRIDPGTGILPLQGRQRAYPALAALTSGPGDFHVTGAVTAANNELHLGYLDNQQGLHIQWNRSGFNGESSLVNHRGQGPGGFTFDQTNNGTNVVRLATVYTDGTLSAGQNSGAVGLRVGEVGHGSMYLGIAREGLGTNKYALLQDTAGGTFLNAAAGQELHLRNENNEIITVSGSQTTVQTSLNINGTGGNTPHGCIVRTQSSSYVTGCAAGEIAISGGGRCNSLWRLTESLPWRNSDAAGALNYGETPTGWRAVCQVWGDAGSYTPPQLGVWAVCCRQ